MARRSARLLSRTGLACARKAGWLKAKTRSHLPRRFWVERLEERNVLSANPLAGSEAFSPPFDPDLWQQVQSTSGSGGAAAVPFDPAQAFNLHSLPGATKTIYLDFDGHTTVNTPWNEAHEFPSIVTPTYDSDGDLITFSVDERLAIYAVWQRVAEDFLPFNVNVTTQDPGVEALRNTTDPDDPEDPDDPVVFDDEWGIRIVIGGNENTWYHPEPIIVSGGVAHIGSFTSAIDDPCFVFAGDFPTAIEFIGEAASHEAGHTLGLVHDSQFRYGRDVTDADMDGNPDQDPPPTVQVFLQYYPGHGYTTNFETSWHPIMGAGAGMLSQWSNAQYINATNDAEGMEPLQDDLTVITTQNGFGYRDDDHGSSIETADVFVEDFEQTTLFAEGIIEQNTDVDHFSFVVEGLGEWFTFDISPFAGAPNLDVLASIWDSSGRELFRSNPLDGIGAGGQTYGAFADGGWAELDALGNILGYVDTFSLLPGTYSLSVDGTSRPTTFIDPAIHPGPPDVTADTAPELDELDAKDFPFDTSDWGYNDYGSLGYYSITGTRKNGLVVGVDFDAAGGASPFNWTSFAGGGSSATLTDLISEAGFTTAYDLTISTSGTMLGTSASQNPVDSAQLPNHSLPLDELGGYLTAEDGETLSFVWSDLDPDTVYQIFVFGHADIAVENDVTVTGGYWNGDPTQNYEFIQTIGADGMAVNGDNEAGGEDLSTLSLLVISNEFGEISIDVTNTDGHVVGIAGVAITTTEIGSLQGQKWNDNGGIDPTLAGNGGGSADPGEEGLPGWVIYLDLNNNSVLDMESTPNQTITKSAPEVPQTIPDYATVKNELVIGTEDFGGPVGPILDVNVTMSITHGFVGDLNVRLLGPADDPNDPTSGVKLVFDRGGNGDNFTNTKFDDSAATSITTINSVGAPYTGTWRPEQPLSFFNGKDAIGKWTLEIKDDQPGFAGTLTSWSIEIEVEGITNILEPFQITDAEGNYTFDALKPGVYYVREYIQEQQAIDGWRQSWAAPPVTVTSGGDITGVDFGNWIPIFSPGSVAGQVWNDVDGDGEKDADEQGLEGWSVYIDANKNGVRDVGTVPVTAEATSLPKAITDFSTVTSSINVDDLGAVLDIEVTLDITHSFMADIEAFLTSPSGRIVELFSGVGAQFNDFQNMTFSDDAVRSITTIGQADLPYTGTWRPEVPLATFFGDETVGLWTLTIRDTTFADEGTLNSWSLSVTTGERFAVTDEEGNYAFDDLPPGQYIIREELQSGWQPTFAPTIVDDGLGNLYNISITAGNTVEANFGNFSAAPELPGDFNRDGFVNAGDYLIYRKMQGTAVANNYDGADGNGDGTVGPEDLLVWQQNFGRTLGGEGGGGGGGAESRSESGSGGSEIVAVENSAQDTPAASIASEPSIESSSAESVELVAASTYSASIEQSVAAETVSAVDSVEQHVSESSSFGNVYSQFASSTRSLGSSSDAAESSNSSAESTMDAALIALLKSLDDAPERLGNDFAGSGDALEGQGGDDDLAGEYGDAVEGLDALFELIGA
jgi:subtilisin-like proprotein convertase family protein